MAPQKFSNQALASLLIRSGLAVTFAYASISALLQPNLWIDYIPPFLTPIASARFLLDTISLFQLLLVVWLLSGRYVWAAAVLAAGLLIGIVVTSPGLFVITFRDLGLGLCALGLVALQPPSPALIERFKRLRRR